MGTRFIQVFFFNRWCDGGVTLLHHVRSATKKEWLIASHSLLARRHEIPKIDWCQRQAVWCAIALRLATIYAVFRGMLCHHDKWRDVMREIWLLPKCTMTGWQHILGDDRQWNQVVRRNRYRRTSYCHHCHWLLDHRLSVSDTNVLLFHQMVHWIYSHFVYVYTDWHDGGKVPWAHQPRQADEWRHCLFDRTVQIQIDRISSGLATGYDWATLTSLRHIRESNDTFGQDI